MVTFLDDGCILAKYGFRFLKFDSTGFPLDEIEFSGLRTKFLGEKYY